MNIELISDDLFSKILIEPYFESADKLYIVSGYASSAMAFHHTEELRKRKKRHSITIQLIIGMACKDGLSEANHRGFQSLMDADLNGIFECSYLYNFPPTHSKVYVWTKDDEPIIGFTGSANYSQQAFISGSQREVATQCHALGAYNYYQSLIDDTIYCTDQKAEEVIALYQENGLPHSTHHAINKENRKNDAVNKYSGLDHLTVSWINRRGDVSGRSGLNWGQRQGREPNQAYIPLNSEICRSDFFPERAQHFTINTDDGKVLICTRAQDNGKAIESPHNNSLLGKYFRFRLNIPSGDKVAMEDLINYGRTDIDFYKIDEENYYMDFSV